MRAAVLFGILVAGCSAHDDLALFELERVEPSEVESGETLRVVGSGFALGRTPEIVLRGIAYRPGRAPLPIERVLSGSVHSESSIEIAVDDALLEAVGGRATVDGTIWVGFRTDDDRRDIFSETRARIDFLPETSTTLRIEGGQPQVADGFGVTLSKEELGTVGVRVESVQAGGLAARQGVRPGDRLIGLDGMTLYSWRDFSPDPTTSESTVYAEREGLRGTHALRWPHAVTARAREPWSVALFALLGLVLGWVSPFTLIARRSPSSVVRLSSVWARAAMLASGLLISWLAP